MRIVITSDGPDLESPASPVFGRCPFYILVDSETLQFEAIANPAASASGGAGIQAAQFVIERGAQAVLTGNLGPNTFNVFQAAQVPAYLISAGTVRQAVEAYKAGYLSYMADANVQAHAGMGGMGMGAGRGRAIQRGAWGTTPSAPATPPSPRPSREEEIASLRDMAGDLRKRLAEIMGRLEKLEKEG